MRDDDREEADQRDHDELREDPKAPPEDEQRRDHGDRDRLRADGERVDGAAQRRREVDRTASAKPTASASSSPSTTSSAVTVSSPTAGRRCSTARRDACGAGSTSVFDAPRGRHTAPTRRAAGREQQRQRRQQPARRRAAARRRRAHDALRRASAPSARSRSATTSASVRARGRASATSSSADHATGPRREHEHAVGEQDRLLDVVGDEHDRARLARERRREPGLHLRAGDRVERAERLVEAQQRLARRAACAGTPRAGACRRRARAGGRARSRPARARRTARPPAPRAGARESPRDAQRERGVVERAQPRQQQVALGHQHRGRALDPPSSGRCSPQISSSSVLLPQPLGPTTATQLAGRARSEMPASAGTAGRRARAVGAAHSSTRSHRRRRAGSRRRRLCAGLQFGRHFTPFAGITPQVLRVGAGGISSGAPSQPAFPPAPLVSVSAALRRC